MINSEWAYVQKKARYPESPETGAQWEFVRSFGRPKVVVGGGMEVDRILGTVGGEEEALIGSRLASAGARW